MNYIQGVTQNKQVAVVVHKHLMRAIRSAEWVAEELVREWTIAELGCKGDTAILLSAMPMLKYCEALSGELRDLPAGAGNN